MNDMEEARAYDMHHWECPYCGAGYEQEEDLPDTFECTECKNEFRLK